MPAAEPPDFQDAALNVNVVFRWEYRLGSTIYFVYSRSQIPTVPVPTMWGSRTRRRSIRTPSATAATSDVFLLKFSSWWASQPLARGASVRCEFGVTGARSRPASRPA